MLQKLRQAHAVMLLASAARDKRWRPSMVLIDLKEQRELWEDFYDRALAESRRGQPRESLASVAARLATRPASTRKLHGAEDLWRVIYAIDDAKHLIDVRVVRHRKDAYR